VLQDQEHIGKRGYPTWEQQVGLVVVQAHYDLGLMADPQLEMVE
jgi:hypothetical protein